MGTTDSIWYPPEDPARSMIEKGMADSQLRGLLADLIALSTDLNIRVWLDGIYTEVENSSVRGEWMRGREVYFKVEGKVDNAKKSEDGSNGGSQ